MIQLDMFEEYDELQSLRMQLKAIKESNDKVRRGMFVRYNELSRMYMEVVNRLEIIEKGICNEQKS